MVFFHFTLLKAEPDSLSRSAIIQPRFQNNFDYRHDTTNHGLSRSLTAKDTSQQKIYSKIHESADKNYFTRKLYGLFFRRQDIEVAGRVFTKTDATEKFVQYAGKKIGSIELIKLKAFGQSIFDTTIQPTTWIEKSSNSLHIRTASFIIRNNLLFKEGDVIQPIDLAESEQLLRNLSFIEDARIVINQNLDSTSVDVKVITKDKWSIGFDMQVNNVHSTDFQIYDKNLGGLGILANGYLYRDDQLYDVWGQKCELRLPNIGGSFIQGNIWYRQGQSYRSFAVNFKRDFYASKAKFAGGVGIINSSEPYKYKSIDSVSQIDYRSYDFWLGRSIRISRRSIIKAPNNLVLAVRYVNRDYYERPEVKENKNYFFHNKEYYLAGISVTHQNLYKANLIYGFGSTEDIPTGFGVHATSGVEHGEFENRIYLGNELSGAKIANWGYFFASARVGGFISSLNEIQQITLNVRSTYFSNLFSISRLDMRQFVRVDYTRGIDRIEGEGELLFLDRNHGIRGLTSPLMSGTTRLVCNLETVAFSPLFVFGFRFAFFGFCDFGAIGPTDKSLIGDQPFSGFGLGVRIRNENLVFNTFQFRLGYYPIIPEKADVAYWLISGQQNSVFENFRAKEPQILPFE